MKPSNTMEEERTPRGGRETERDGEGWRWTEMGKLVHLGKSFRWQSLNMEGLNMEIS